MAVGRASISQVDIHGCASKDMRFERHLSEYASALFAVSSAAADREVAALRMSGKGKKEIHKGMFYD